MQSDEVKDVVEYVDSEVELDEDAEFPGFEVVSPNLVSALGVPRPACFRFGEDFRAFSRNFTDYCVLSIGTTKDQRLQLFLLAFVDERTKGILRDVDLTLEEKQDAKLFLAKYADVLHPEYEKRSLRIELRLLRQESNEAVMDFAERVRGLSRRAYGEEYSELKEESRCAVFVDGLSSIGMKREILMADEHSFDRSVKLARHVEMIETRVRDIEAENVHRIRPFQQVRSNQQCGNDRRNDVVQSPWWANVECYYCHRLGHIRWHCPELARRREISLKYKVAEEERVEKGGSYKTYHYQLPKTNNVPHWRAFRRIVKKKTTLTKDVTGVVRWFNVKRGYGFIMRNDNKKDVFVHCTGITRYNPQKEGCSLEDNEIVRFDIVRGRKGVEASNVTGPAGEAVKGSRHARRRDDKRYRMPYSDKSQETINRVDAYPKAGTNTSGSYVIPQRRSCSEETEDQDQDITSTRTEDHIRTVTKVTVTSDEAQCAIATEGLEMSKEDTPVDDDGVERFSDEEEFSDEDEEFSDFCSEEETIEEYNARIRRRSEEDNRGEEAVNRVLSTNARAVTADEETGSTGADSNTMLLMEIAEQMSELERWSERTKNVSSFDGTRVATQETLRKLEQRYGTQEEIADEVMGTSDIKRRIWTLQAVRSKLLPPEGIRTAAEKWEYCMSATSNYDRELHQWAFGIHWALITLVDQWKYKPMLDIEDARLKVVRGLICSQQDKINAGIPKSEQTQELDKLDRFVSHYSCHCRALERFLHLKTWERYVYQKDSSIYRGLIFNKRDLSLMEQCEKTRQFAIETICLVESMPEGETGTERLRNERLVQLIKMCMDVSRRFDDHRKECVQESSTDREPRNVHQDKVSGITDSRGESTVKTGTWSEGVNTISIGISAVDAVKELTEIVGKSIKSQSDKEKVPGLMTRIEGYQLTDKGKAMFL